MHMGRMETFTDGVIAVIITIMVLELKFALAWIPLLRTLIAANGGERSRLRQALQGDWKTIVSPVGYVIGIALAFFAPILSCVIYGVIAALWLIPDRRLEVKLYS